MIARLVRFAHKRWYGATVEPCHHRPVWAYAATLYQSIRLLECADCGVILDPSEHELRVGCS